MEVGASCQHSSSSTLEIAVQSGAKTIAIWGQKHCPTLIPRTSQQGYNKDKSQIQSVVLLWQPCDMARRVVRLYRLTALWHLRPDRYSTVKVSVSCPHSSSATLDIAVQAEKLVIDDR